MLHVRTPDRTTNDTTPGRRAAYVLAARTAGDHGTIEAVRIRVRVTPRASKDEIAGTRDGVLLVRTTAPPVGGKANAAGRKIVARAANVPPTTVTVVRGDTAREKTIDIKTDDEATVRARLGL